MLACLPADVFGTYQGAAEEEVDFDKVAVGTWVPCLPQRRVGHHIANGAGGICDLVHMCSSSRTYNRKQHCQRCQSVHCRWMGRVGGGRTTGKQRGRSGGEGGERENENKRKERMRPRAHDLESETQTERKRNESQSGWQREKRRTTMG